MSSTNTNYVACKFCNRLILPNNLSRHESTCPKNYPSTRFSTDILNQLDDDGKLYSNYKGRVGANKSAKHKFLLTFEEFCDLLLQAGIRSSDLGYNGNNYDLARYHDIGDYTFGNCRFIPHKDNLDERLYNGLTDVERRKLREQENEAIQLRKQQRKDLSIQKQKEYESRKDPRFSGVHNSSYGSHWITNGVNNKKWRHWKDGDIPEGWRLGRIMNSGPVVQLVEPAPHKRQVAGSCPARTTT